MRESCAACCYGVVCRASLAIAHMKPASSRGRAASLPKKDIRSYGSGRVGTNSGSVDAGRRQPGTRTLLRLPLQGRHTGREKTYPRKPTVRSSAPTPYFQVSIRGFARFGGRSSFLRDGFDQIELTYVETNFRPHFMAHILQSFTGNAFSPITRFRKGYFTTRRRFLTFMLPGSCLDAVLR